MLQKYDLLINFFNFWKKKQILPRFGILNMNAAHIHMAMSISEELFRKISRDKATAYEVF